MVLIDKVYESSLEETPYSERQSAKDFALAKVKKPHYSLHHLGDVVKDFTRTALFGAAAGGLMSAATGQDLAEGAQQGAFLTTYFEAFLQSAMFVDSHFTWKSLSPMERRVRYELISVGHSYGFFTQNPTKSTSETTLGTATACGIFGSVLGYGWRSFALAAVYGLAESAYETLWQAPRTVAAVRKHALGKVAAESQCVLEDIIGKEGKEKDKQNKRQE